MKKRILNYEDLDVYQLLCKLHLEVNELSFMFPSFEMNEIGAELRRASNSAPANIAEGYSNKQTSYYLEKINESLGNVRHTKHHLYIACKKTYIDQSIYDMLESKYAECERMLKDLGKSIHSKRSRHNMFTKNQFPQSYGR